MERYQPSILFHAAAYKHVPMMERHVFAAVENNIFGTWNVARAAIDHGMEDFVMISSDKAVRPTSMMGATKRISELVINAHCKKQSGTRLSRYALETCSEAMAVSFRSSKSRLPQAAR